MFTDHKPLIAIFKKDVASLSNRLQSILLMTKQHNVKMLYKPGPQLFIRDMLSNTNMKHTEMKKYQAYM